MAVLPKLCALNTIRVTLLLWRAASMPADILCLLDATTLAHGWLLLLRLRSYDWRLLGFFFHIKNFIYN